jgi:hypothetical protein
MADAADFLAMTFAKGAVYHAFTSSATPFKHESHSPSRVETARASAPGFHNPITDVGSKRDTS